ncbi:MAG: hypothetical protein QGI86_07795 [Candidatus Poribacteria bacterium]|jgi:hypothetical protein|nr:hypothetical protein [Candidatus Poribacteria bacterium]MDP6750533.1 hypothetical protein [Candidatus Poribacteria bacterium]MDP6997651.1 hypothetical protein [Candidatus Poribacteria bacterium]
MKSLPTIYCLPEHTRENFMHLFNQYEDESREFSQAPFWFWNDELSEGEISRQLDEFQAHGIHAFVIHPRAGLPQSLAWMSERLLYFMRFAIAEAARRGMWVILYDEGMYPSGSSAGQVVEENPQFACRGWVAVDLTEASPESEIQGVRIDAQSRIQLNATQTLIAEVERRHDGHRLAIVDQPIHTTIRGLHFIEPDPPRRQDQREVDECHPAAADLLNPDAMACFIDKVYQRYYDEFTEYFGTTIRAIFTDEPSPLGKHDCPAGWAPRPGTSDALAHINRLLEYDFTPHLPALWDEREPQAERYRTDYTRAIKARLEETYYQPISTWCRRHGVQLAGHPGASDDIGMLRHFDLPGQDLVLRYVEPGKASALEGAHSTMGKCASSAMVHLGARRNSNEFAGAYGHQLTFAEYHWMALWLLIRGCNLLIPHAFYYSIRGPRIDERPRDVGLHSPWWEDYARFSNLTGRICWLNTDSQLVCDTAILGTGDFLPWEAAKACFQHQHDFNYLTIEDLASRVERSEDGLRIAGMTYRALVVEPAVADRLSATEREVVSDIERRGLVVRWKGAAETGDFHQRIHHIVPSPLTFTPAHPDLRVRHVCKGDMAYILLFNEGEKEIQTRVAMTDSSVTGDGRLVNMDTEQETAWQSDDPLDLPPHGCFVLALPIAPHST